MAWPQFVPNAQHRDKGSGFLLAAPEGTPVPDLGVGVAGGKFTATWDAAWKQLGRTSEDGINITFGQESASYSSSQEAYPFITKTTSRSATAAFTLYDYNQFNIQVALNGGNWAVSGSGASQFAKYTPANPGEDTYTMLAWIGPTDDEVCIFYKASSTAEVSMDMSRDDPRPLALTMTAILPEVAVADRPLHWFTAGVGYNNL